MGKRGKMRHEEDVFWGHDDTYVEIEGTQDLRERNREERGEAAVAYAPCPNPDAKWKALLAVCAMPGWNGTMKGVMACLIECANFYSGKCCPSEEWIAAQLGCDPCSVKRAIKRLKSKYLMVLHRNLPTDTKWKSNAYLIGWTALINRCHHVFPWTDRKHRGATLHEQGGNVAQNRGAEVPRKDIEKRNIEGRYEPKRVHPPSAADTNLYSLSERKGIQERGEVESASTNPQPPEGPSYGEAQERVSGYCVAFHWDHLTEQEFDAAVAAEVQEVGSGRALIDAAAQNTWQAKRKGQRQ